VTNKFVTTWLVFIVSGSRPLRRLLKICFPPGTRLSRAKGYSEIGAARGADQPFFSSAICPE
jgi:hypothetical protein